MKKVLFPILRYLQYHPGYCLLSQNRCMQHLRFLSHRFQCKQSDHHSIIQSQYKGDL